MCIVREGQFTMLFGPISSMPYTKQSEKFLIDISGFTDNLKITNFRFTNNV